MAECPVLLRRGGVRHRTRQIPATICGRRPPVANVPRIFDLQVPGAFPSPNFRAFILQRGRWSVLGLWLVAPHCRTDATKRTLADRLGRWTQLYDVYWQRWTGSWGPGVPLEALGLNRRRQTQRLGILNWVTDHFRTVAAQSDGLVIH